MATFDCPICGSTNCKREETIDFSFMVRCERGYAFRVADDIDQLPKSLQDKLYNLIFEHIIRKPTADKRQYWFFYYEPANNSREEPRPPTYNLAEAMRSYPAEFMERANRTLLNLSIIHPKYGDIIGVDWIDYRATYSDGEDFEEEASGAFNLLTDLGYLKNGNHVYVLSADGWRKIEELRKKQQEIMQGFIAMAFREETKPIRESFRKAIEASGYTASLIDEKEHNNQIVPEIFYEIDRSKFVVVDITCPNYGAYYEAGYAQGQGKQVIVCCKKEVFENKEGKYERPHFDISQKAMVIWDDDADLVERLKRRIEATVE